MTELQRQLRAEDLPEVRRILQMLFHDDGYADIARLNGMTNRTYKVTRHDGCAYVVRLPGEGTAALINRADERKSTRLACKLGIDTELLHFGDDGVKVMRFVPEPQPMSEAVLRREDILTQAAAIFHRLHTCGEDTGVRFEVFEMADAYENIIRENQVALYDDYAAVRQTVADIKADVDRMGAARRVPCHNDALVGNWVLGQSGELFLVDWEYSGMNEAMWDLSCLSIEAEYAARHDDLLLRAYYGRDISADERKRFVAAKLYVDTLWTLWGLTRVPYEGAFMQEYADFRYARLKRNIDAYRCIACVDADET